MHFEVLSEDQSGALFLKEILPKVWGANGDLHSWRIHAFEGVGRIPQNLNKQSNPKRRTLLDRLPPMLRAYGKTFGIDAILIVLDADNQNPHIFLNELNLIKNQCSPHGKRI